MLVRSWNLFHGNTLPPHRRSFLAEMVRFASADKPDILCLQELPVWSLARLERWSGMQAVGDVAKRPLLPDPLAKAITDIHTGFFRSAFTGQGNAILLAPGVRVIEHRVAPISSQEDRICSALKLEGGLVVANLHGSGRRRGVEAVELERSLALLDALEGEPTILAGDFNQRPHVKGFSPPGPWIDHIFVRSAPATPLEVWPVERRTVGGRVLSDHAPVELDVEI